MGFSKFFLKVGIKKGLLAREPEIRYKFALYYFFTIVSELSELNKFSNISQGGKFLTLSENEKIKLRKKILDLRYNLTLKTVEDDYSTMSEEDKDLHDYVSPLSSVEEELKAKKEVWNKLCGGIFFLSRIELEATNFTEHKLLRGIDLEAIDPISKKGLKYIWLSTVSEFCSTKSWGFVLHQDDWTRFEELQEVYDYLKKIL